MTELCKFLKSYYSDNGNRTHTSMGGITKKGTWNIPIDKYEIFLDKYISAVKQGANLSLVERVPDSGISYLLIDIDYDQKSAKRLYKKDHIKELKHKTNLT